MGSRVVVEHQHLPCSQRQQRLEHAADDRTHLDLGGTERELFGNGAFDVMVVLGRRAGEVVDAAVENDVGSRVADLEHGPLSLRPQHHRMGGWGTPRRIRLECSERSGRPMSA